jgi:streptomycin 6-kinase
MTIARRMPNSMLHYFINHWRLIPEGSPIITRTSRLLPVRWQDVRAMLKVAVDHEEELGNELFAWWNGQGVPLVLAREGKGDPSGAGRGRKP